MMLQELSRSHRTARHAVLCGLLIFCSCGQPDSDRSAAVPSEEGVLIPVTSDPAGATYYLLDWSEQPDGNRVALTRREGRSGTSFARREINCEARTFRYLGEGETRTEAEADSPNRGDMAELVPGSISSEVADYVCQE